MDNSDNFRININIPRRNNEPCCSWRQGPVATGSTGNPSWCPHWVCQRSRECICFENAFCLTTCNAIQVQQYLAQRVYLPSGDPFQRVLPWFLDTHLGWHHGSFLQPRRPLPPSSQPGTRVQHRSRGRHNSFTLVDVLLLFVSSHSHLDVNLAIIKVDKENENIASFCHFSQPI